MAFVPMHHPSPLLEEGESSLNALSCSTSFFRISPLNLPHYNSYKVSDTNMVLSFPSFLKLSSSCLLNDLNPFFLPLLGLISF